MEKALDEESPKGDEKEKAPVSAFESGDWSESPCPYCGQAHFYAHCPWGED
jgi:hypothetical protein